MRLFLADVLLCLAYGLWGAAAIIVLGILVVNFAKVFIVLGALTILVMLGFWIRAAFDKSFLGP